jgi:23S rRNA (adenine2503-C2)-methyltransferase
MIAGETTTVEAATHLARWVGEMPALLNLIPINDPSGQRQTPSEDELDAFLGELRQRTRLPVVRRYSGGQDIDGACGMLVARYGEAL